MTKPKIYADFQNADSSGRVRLNCIGTLDDLARQQVQLHDGMLLSLYADDADVDGAAAELQVDGIVSFSSDEHCWVATIDWTYVGRQHASPIPRS